MQQSKKKIKLLLTILINENKEKPYKQDETSAFYDYVIQPSDRPINLIVAFNAILDFNETI